MTPSPPTYALGIDIGVTNVKLAGASAAGAVLFREQFETRADSPDWPARVKARVGEVESRAGPARSVGVAAPASWKSIPL